MQSLRGSLQTSLGSLASSSRHLTPASLSRQPVIEFKRHGTVWIKRTGPGSEASTGVNAYGRVPGKMGSSRQGKKSKTRVAAGGDALFKRPLPLINSLRHVRLPLHEHLWKGEPYRPLTIPKRGTGGRNNTGRITVRGRGAGHKRRIRLLDFHRSQQGEMIVRRIEYDPGRTAHIALVEYIEEGKEGKKAYILAPEELKVGDSIRNYRQGLDASVDDNRAPTLPTDPAAPQTVAPPSLALTMARAAALRPGNLLPLHAIPLGLAINSISLRQNGPGILARSAGASATVIAVQPDGFTQVKMASGEVRLVRSDCCAVVGVVSNKIQIGKSLGKAGRARWLGWRPKVRGVAMNSVDHPHGGGRGKSKSNKHPRTPWGILTKGFRTRRPGPGGNTMVVKQRPRIRAQD
ncbi:uncharacterized protein L969DRAFT_91570 [Mixia osmundae IAM 14324]|uniref:Uncharacterized protein n=1 Tax=Mixia osmundae (strain CBS 9802 / IAM 14324 / JCM 22182 / KY 12970) TaxID=764103 RepID=G7DZV5_MIXOS|nr:uncharacterized protein L969DRAFT_91570 [Mixia osmundae IAM 14324]KEI42108.1 hypothetical protein L969DRAFT_91570 [Mixia osmundae IAM 14324]GAA96115.1 hypothetical protein E5Q_02776 [Mixia osmundae IAM 14324]